MIVDKYLTPCLLFFWIWTKPEIIGYKRMDKLHDNS